MPQRRSGVPCAAFFLAWLALPALPALAAAEPAPAPATPAQPGAPAVSDEMLSPAPTARRVIRSWDEALALIRSRSPDYITGYESVKRAEAQSRIALAAVLPTLNGLG